MDETKEDVRRPGAEKMEALSRFSGKMAHDLNNIFGAVEGYATLTARSPGADQQIKEDMDEIRKAVARAASLTEQLLIFSGRFVPRPEPCDIGALLSALVVKNPGPPFEKVKIEINVKPGTPVIKADPELLEKAVLNLLVNAGEAMPAGGVIRVEAEKINAEGPDGGPAEDFLKISVYDAGPGPASDILEKAFEPFFTTKQKGTGSGMGLPTAYGIVKGHGGWIEGGRSPSGGGEFSLFFPVEPR